MQNLVEQLAQGELSFTEFGTWLQVQYNWDIETIETTGERNTLVLHLVRETDERDELNFPIMERDKLKVTTVVAA